MKDLSDTTPKKQKTKKNNHVALFSELHYALCKRKRVGFK